MTIPTLDELLNETVEKNCSCCQGMSLPGRKRGQNGHCPVCLGAAYVKLSRYAALTDAERVEVLEAEVMRLRPDLKKKYKKKAE